jgi:hypothetical protein
VEGSAGRIGVAAELSRLFVRVVGACRYDPEGSVPNRGGAGVGFGERARGEVGEDTVELGSGRGVGSVGDDAGGARESAGMEPVAPWSGTNLDDGEGSADPTVRENQDWW